jgi:polyisoprenyl-phosphate glycosyltransferase
LSIIISFFGSLILICLGIIGEYIVRIYDEVRNRPYVVIERTINF